MKKLLRMYGLLMIALCAVVLCNSCSKDDDSPTTVTYTVTFDTDGGTSISSQTVESGECATQPSDPTKDGYTFDGWCSNATCTTVWSFSTPITGNTTIYAKWQSEDPTEDPTEDPVATYAVTFDTDGGTTISSQTVEEGECATQPSDPTKDGYTFAGWYSDAACTTAWSFSTPITSDTTIYAKWEVVVTYTVTFDTDGGTTIASQTVEEGACATQPSDPTKDNYTFAGWYADAACSTVWSFDTAITGDTTIYAKWVSTDSELTDMETGTIW